MVQQVIQFPQFPDDKVFITFIQNLEISKLETIKQQLIGLNPDYDYCFLNTNHIASLEHLYFGIHKAILNKNNDNMKAKTLNTEIMFNLSPINNIMDAIKRFGVDTSCTNLICIKVLSSTDTSDDEGLSLNKKILDILDVDGKDNVVLNDETILDLLNIQKLKKLFKLSDLKLSDDKSELQGELTRLAIGACVSK